MHTERTRVATITRLKSGSWRVQVRRKGKYVNETFLRRKDAEEWGIDIERRIDRQEPTTTRQSRDVQLFGDLIALHRQDLEEVGKDIGRSKTASLIFLDERLGHLRLPELDRERFIKFGKERAPEEAGPGSNSRNQGTAPESSPSIDVNRLPKPLADVALASAARWLG